MAPPPSQDEALSRYSASGEVPREELEVERAIGTLDATHKVLSETDKQELKLLLLDLTSKRMWANGLLFLSPCV